MTKIPLYHVEDGENAVPISELPNMEGIVAICSIKPDRHFQVTRQADLEGFVLCQQENELRAYDLVWFGKDSKMFLDIHYSVAEKPTLQSILLHDCTWKDSHSQPLSSEILMSLLKV